MPVRETPPRRAGSWPARPVLWSRPGSHSRQSRVFAAVGMEVTGETDWLAEGDGFEPSVPQQIRSRFRDSSPVSHDGLTVSRPGTESSNPSPSSAESANHRFLSSRQAITCVGTYQRLQGRRVAADTAIWHRKVRDNGRRYGREHRPADRWAPGPARLLFLPSYCRRSAPTLRSGSPRAASCRSLPR